MELHRIWVGDVAPIQGGTSVQLYHKALRQVYRTKHLLTKWTSVLPIYMIKAALIDPSITTADNSKPNISNQILIFKNPQKIKRFVWCLAAGLGRGCGCWNHSLITDLFG